MTDQTPEPTSIPILDAEERVHRHIRQFVWTGAAIACSPAPEESDVYSAIAELQHNEEEFQTWPLSNKRGEQSTYLEHLLERVVLFLVPPTPPQEGDAYIDASTQLPELPQEAGDAPAGGEHVADRPSAAELEELQGEE